jgi:hypothetical protein
MLPTPGDVHVNVPLTNVSVAYVMEQANFIASQAVPTVPVDKQQNKYWSFDKRYWRRDQFARRSPGTPAKRVDYGVDSTNSYSADIWSLAKDIADELRRNADAGLDQDRIAVKLLTQLAMIRMEKLFATAFLTTDSVWSNDFTPGTLWSSSSSTPLEDVATGKSTVLQATGMEPMHMAITYPVWLALKNHPEIVDRIKYGQTAGTGPAKVTPQAVAALMELEDLYICKASEDTSNEGAAAANSFIGGKNGLLFYKQPNPALEMPSAFYNFAWTGYLGAGANGQRVLRYRQPEMYHADSIELEMAFDMKAVAADCGYRFKNTVA